MNIKAPAATLARFRQLAKSERYRHGEFLEILMNAYEGRAGRDPRPQVPVPSHSPSRRLPASRPWKRSYELSKPIIQAAGEYADSGAGMLLLQKSGMAGKAVRG